MNLEEARKLAQTVQEYPYPDRSIDLARIVVELADEVERLRKVRKEAIRFLQGGNFYGDLDEAEPAKDVWDAIDAATPKEEKA